MTDTDRLLQDILTGDASDQDAAIRTRLAGEPRLRARLAALRDAQQRLAAIGEITPELAAEAAGLATAADRDRVAAALLPRSTNRTRLFATVGLLAAALLVAVLWINRPTPPADGHLGGGAAVSLQLADGRWRLAIADALPPGTSYHLRLELADGTTSTATADARTWQFPDAWNEAANRSGGGRLVVQWDDGTGLAVRHTLPLR